jgi:hypothetical protein
MKMREETLLEKVVIAIMFLAILVFAAWVPDFVLTEEECKKQDPRAYVGSLCDKSKANENRVGFRTNKVN